MRKFLLACNTLNRELTSFFSLKNKLVTRSLTLVFLSITFGFNCYSQTLENVNVFGGRGILDHGNGITYDEIGNIYATGLIDGHSLFGDKVILTKDFGDAFIAKYDSIGNVIWVKTINGTKKEVGNRIVYKEGFLYLAGTFNDTINLADQHISNGNDDPFIVKMDTTGNFIWSKSFGGLSGERITNLKLDNNGDLYLLGYYRHPFTFEGFDFTAEQKDNYFLLKFDSFGSLIWAKDGKGSGNINAFGIGIDKNNNIALSGSFRGECIIGDSIFNSTTSMGFIGLYDKDFNLIRVKSYKGSAPKAIVFDQYDNLYLTGNYKDSLRIDTCFVDIINDNYQIYIAKLSNELKAQWIRSEGSLYGTNNITSIDLFEDKLYIGGAIGKRAIFVGEEISGSEDYNPFIACFQVDGTYNWASSFESSFTGYLSDIDVSYEGEPVIIGKFNRYFSNDTIISTALGSNEIYIVKYGSGENYEWVKTAGSGSWDIAKDICFDNDGNYYVYGAFDGVNIFNGILYNSNGLDDIYLMKFNKDDEILWIKTFGGIWDEESGSITVDSLGNIYLTGSFCGEIQFDKYTITPEGKEDIFLCQLNPSGDVQWVKKYKSSYYYINPKVRTDDENNVYLAFTVYTNNVQIEDTIINNYRRDLLIVKYKNNGDLIWVRASSGNGSKENRGFRIFNDDLYLVGSFSGEFALEDTVVSSGSEKHGYLLKIDKQGNLSKLKTISSTNKVQGADIAVNKYGNIYVPGHFLESFEFTDSVYTTDEYYGEMFIARYNMNLDEDTVYVPKVGNMAVMYSDFSIQLDQVSDIYLLGTSNFYIDFGNSITMPRGYSSRTFMVKFDKDFKAKWITYNSNNSGSAGSNSLSICKSGCYLTGTVSDRWSFGDFNSQSYSSSGTQKDAFVAKIKFDCLPVGPTGNIKFEETSNQFEKTIIADINNAIDFKWEMPDGVEIISTDIYKDTVRINISESFNSGNITVYGINECGDKSHTLSHFLNLSNNCYSIVDTSICDGMSYFAQGMEQTIAGIYYDTLQNVGDCDSIIVTTLKIDPNYNLSETVEVNHGGNYTFPDGTTQENIASQTIYTSNLQTILGCDSIIETTVNVNQTGECQFTESFTICSGSDYTFPDGTTEENITSQVVHESIILSNIACDTVIETTVNVNPVSINNLVDTICYGESIQIAYAICTGTGVYGVILTNQYGCDSTVSLDLTVIKPQIDLGRNRTIDLNDTILLDAGDGFETYNWNTQETTQTILVDEAYGEGEHTFKVIVTDERNCTGSDSTLITLRNVTDISSINGLGEIKIYPNPTTGKINIEFSENNKPIEISIFDITGKLLIQKKIDSNQSSFETEILGEKGVYFIRLRSDLKSNTFKIIKN